MATKIRLQRGGTTNRPFYRFIVTPETSPRDSNFIEKLGTYDPLISKDNPERIKVDKDRILYWLSVGAVPSEKVAILITKAGIANDNATVKKVLKRREKSIADRKAAAEAKKKAEEAAAKAEADKAAAEAAAAAAPAEAAPAAEAPAEAPAA
jgi:small subunit ribosomal protein S16